MTLESNPYSLIGKVILVTGASSGIGKATARLCSEMGAQVVVTGRNENRLLQTFNALSGEGHQMIVADLTKKENVEHLCKTTPQLDGIVHCAGIVRRQLCKSVTEEDIALVISTNFNAVALLQAGLLSSKKIKKEASIVFISSRAAETPAIANAVYSASKGAIVSYARCLSLELAPKRIRVNCILPAVVLTPIILESGVAKEQLEDELSRYPLGRYGQPEDIANLAVFLLSDAASWMTGSCIDITGGAIGL